MKGIIKTIKEKAMGANIPKKAKSYSKVNIKKGNNGMEIKKSSMITRMKTAK